MSRTVTGNSVAVVPEKTVLAVQLMPGVTSLRGIMGSPAAMAADDDVATKLSAKQKLKKLLVNFTSYFNHRRSWAATYQPKQPNQPKQPSLSKPANQIQAWADTGAAKCRLVRSAPQLPAIHERGKDANTPLQKAGSRQSA